MSLLAKVFEQVVIALAVSFAVKIATDLIDEAA